MHACLKVLKPHYAKVPCLMRRLKYEKRNKRFQSKIEFYFRMITKSSIFTRDVATNENTRPVLVFMGEIKFDLTEKIIIFAVSFMLLFTIIKLLSNRRPSGQKTFFASIRFISAR